MNDLENSRARAEAVEQVPRALRSARRAQLWEGLNRYLASEAILAHGAASAEQKAGRDHRAGRTTPAPAPRRPSQDADDAEPPA